MDAYTDYLLTLHIDEGLPLYVLPLAPARTGYDALTAGLGVPSTYGLL
jgi:hypothetical protein